MNRRLELLEHFQDGMRGFFTMEFVEGIPVDEYVRGPASAGTTDR